MPQKKINDFNIDPSEIEQTEIVELMEKAYIDYAMSVIVQRALPSAEDGLKPVHRRILYAMHMLGLAHNKPTRKSATVVGEVIGKFHPHGDAAVYDALVRLAQEFSMRYPLVQGQGNFGSLDGDPPAAMRYTEARLTKIAEELLADIEKETVNMVANFDGSLKEPEVLPGKFPNLLVNGSTGIAVGMATNIPPHNLREVCDAIAAQIDNPQISLGELLKIVRGPDFPTGCIATGNFKELYGKGKGRITIRARHKIEEHKGRKYIVVTEIPYMVNKAELVKEIAKLVVERKLPDVSDLRDESAKGEIRVVIELKKGAEPKYTINKLYRATRMQSNFDANIIALDGKRPRLLGLKELIEIYLRHRKQVVVNRTKFELRKAEERLEIVNGLLLALKDINNVIALIKKSKTTADAHAALRKKYGLSERQTKAILEMRLQQLTSLEGKKLEDERKKLDKLIAELKKILSSEREVLKVIRKEVLEIKEKYGDERRTKIVGKFEEISEKDLVKEKSVVVMVTNEGYIKRVDLQAYREQARGGMGVMSAELKDNDFVKQFIACSTHDTLLFFTSRGRAFWLKAHLVPEGTRASRGRSLANLFNLREEKIVSVKNIKEFSEDNFLMFATARGIVKKMSLKLVSKPRSTGVRVMNLPADGSDSIVDVQCVSEKSEVMLVTRNGKAVRFSASEVRGMGRASYGVKGAELDKTDRVVSLVSIDKTQTTILSVTEKGFGKRSELESYRKTSRGSKGVINLKVSERTGKVVKALAVDSDDSVMLVTLKGTAIRIPIKELRVMGRATQGVRLMRLKQEDKVADVVKIPKDDGKGRETLS
ncbi:DNA gyrase subunit A [Candidatus Pacearchaeota archaeon]|nr:MAG: DNA gyrase subunit A [Candidatus Pacearchaeota archaeon]